MDEGVRTDAKRERGRASEEAEEGRMGWWSTKRKGTHDKARRESICMTAVARASQYFGWLAHLHHHHHQLSIKWMHAQLYVAFTLACFISVMAISCKLTVPLIISFVIHSLMLTNQGSVEPSNTSAIPLATRYNYTQPHILPSSCPAS